MAQAGDPAAMARIRADLFMMGFLMHIGIADFSLAPDSLKAI
jgi:hypothetical protein